MGTIRSNAWCSITIQCRRTSNTINLLSQIWHLPVIDMRAPLSTQLVCRLYLLFSNVTTCGARHQAARKLSSTYLVAMTTSRCRGHTYRWLLSIKLSTGLRNCWSSSSITATRNIFGASIVLGLVWILDDLLLSTLSISAWRVTGTCAKTTRIVILFLLETSILHPQLCLSILVILCRRLSNLQITRILPWRLLQLVFLLLYLILILRFVVLNELLEHVWFLQFLLILSLNSYDLFQFRWFGIFSSCRWGLMLLLNWSVVGNPSASRIISRFSVITRTTLLNLLTVFLVSIFYVAKFSFGLRLLRCWWSILWWWLLRHIWSYFGCLTDIACRWSVFILSSGLRRSIVEVWRALVSPAYTSCLSLIILLLKFAYNPLFDVYKMSMLKSCKLLKF